MAFARLSYVVLLVFYLNFSCSFTTPACRYEPSFTSSQLRQTEEEDAIIVSPSPQEVSKDLRWYRNRAALTEHILREKMSDLELLQQKLTVLQDVVVRVKRQADGAKDQSSQWQDSYESEVKVRVEAEERTNSLRRELDQTRSELLRQKQRYEADLADVKLLLLNQQKQFANERERMQENEAKARLQMKSLQAEMLEIDQSLEMTQQELFRLKNSASSQEQDLKAALDEELQKRSQMKSELAEVREERDTVIKKLQSLELEMKDSMEIASASVAAADRREGKLRSELSSAMQELRELKSHTDELQATQNVSETGVLPESVEVQLREEIDALEEQIRALKLTHTVQLRSEMRKAKEEIEELEDQFEEQIRQARRANVESREAASEPGATQRLWHRVKNQFRRR